MMKLNMTLTAFVFLLITSGVYGAGYLKIGDIKGESTDKGHEEWVEIISWSFGADRPIDPLTSRARGNITYEPIVIRKRIDKATPLLFTNLAQGKVEKDAIFEFTGIGPDGGEVLVYRVTLGEVTFNYSRQYYPDLEGCPSAEGGLHEELGIVFNSISLESITGGTSGTWNFETGTPKISADSKQIPVEFFYQDDIFSLNVSGKDSFKSKLLNLSGQNVGKTFSFAEKRNLGFSAREWNVNPGLYFVKIEMDGKREGVWPVTIR